MEVLPPSLPSASPATEDRHHLKRTVFGGAIGGLLVDLYLYPLDTLKTRQQSRHGFVKAGGFRNIYRGLSMVALGSAPGSALFFVTYESLKQVGWNSRANDPLHDAFRASVGEIAGCMIRVPTELIKQQAQVSLVERSVFSIARDIYAHSGFRGFYRGYFSTVLREIPFSFVEFPLWEYLKRERSKQKNNEPCTPLESAVCGSISGSVAACLTTPLDVVKTRIMLGQYESIRGEGSSSSRKNKRRIYPLMCRIVRDEGWRRLFSGMLPRALWMGMGGFIFFYGYEFSMDASRKWLF